MAVGVVVAGAAHPARAREQIHMSTKGDFFIHFLPDGFE
jgi:hypothetical protein